MSSEGNFGEDGQAPASDLQEAYVVSVRGQPFAIGLFWNNYESKPSAANEARATAANPNFGGDLYCVRSSGKQYGIAKKENGHAKNMVPLAGALADERGGNWLGVFPIDDGFYIIGVRDDDILTDTDRFIGDELAVRVEFEQHLASSTWNQVYAPANFGIDNTDPTPLEELLGKARSPRLLDTDRVSGLLKMGVGAVVIVALIFGGMWYMQYQAEQEILKAQQIANDKFEQTARENPVVAVPMPWEGRATVGSYLKACMDGLSQAVLDVPGWKTVGLACDQAGVRMTLDRDGDLGEGGGPINWVRWALDRNGLTAAQASPTADNSVEVTWAMGATENHPVDLAEGSPTLRVARRYLQSLFEETFTKITFPNETPLENWAVLNFSFNTPFDPREFESILNKVPGLTIERVVLDLTTLEYNVQGSVYEELEIVNAQLN